MPRLAPRVYNLESERLLLRQLRGQMSVEVCFLVVTVCNVWLDILSGQNPAEALLAFLVQLLTRPLGQVEFSFPVLRRRDPLQVIIESASPTWGQLLPSCARLLIMIDCVSQTCRTMLVNVREIRGRAIVLNLLHLVLRLPDQMNVNARSALE